MKTVAIRGAITVDENTQEAIKAATVELMTAILEYNNLEPKDLAYIEFSATKDITKAYPAKYVRQELEITDVPLMCVQEMDVEGALRMCLRVLIVLSTINVGFKVRHVYLKGAEVLRPDLKN